MRNTDAHDRLIVDDFWKPHDQPDIWERLAMGALAMGALVLLGTIWLDFDNQPTFDMEATQERIRLVAEANPHRARNPDGTCPL